MQISASLSSNTLAAVELAAPSLVAPRIKGVIVLRILSYPLPPVLVSEVVAAVTAPSVYNFIPDAFPDPLYVITTWCHVLSVSVAAFARPRMASPVELLLVSYINIRSSPLKCLNRYSVLSEPESSSAFEIKGPLSALTSPTNTHADKENGLSDVPSVKLKSFWSEIST